MWQPTTYQLVNHLPKNICILLKIISSINIHDFPIINYPTFFFLFSPKFVVDFSFTSVIWFIFVFALNPVINYLTYWATSLSRAGFKKDRELPHGFDFQILSLDVFVNTFDLVSFIVRIVLLIFVMNRIPDWRLFPQTNTSFFSVLCPHSYIPWETSSAIIVLPHAKHA